MKTFFTFLFLLIACTFYSQEEKIDGDPDSLIEGHKADSFFVYEGENIYLFPGEAPYFPGGTDSLKKFIYSSLNYHWQQNVKGTCYLQLIVMADGTVNRIKLLKGIPGCPECDKEAIRVISIFPKFNPGKLNGKPVNILYHIPIKFN